MKTFIHTLFWSTAMMFALSSCSPTEPASNVFLTEQQVSEIIQGGKLIHLNELKQAPYMTEEGNYCDPALYRLRSSGPNNPSVQLFSIDTIPTTNGSLYIRGRITTDDYAGNFYKTLCIQEMVNGRQQALRISVDAGSIGGLYQMGQEILIRIDGLCIGRYANQPQLSLATYNNNTDAMKYQEKVGWEPGRIPLSIFNQRTQFIGLPDKSKLHYDTIGINNFVYDYADEVANRFMDGLLVCIPNVHFTGELYDNGSLTQCSFGNPKTDQNANVFAPTTNNIGFPQSRVISDGSNWTLISTSEYSKYANFYLPGATASSNEGCNLYQGNISGILGYFRDDNFNSSQSKQPGQDKWSITWRTIEDFNLYNEVGEHWNLNEYTAH